mgnify:CR=1 FL=1
MTANWLLTLLLLDIEKIFTNNLISQENNLPKFKSLLPSILSENSGMIFWDNLLWQHNDGGGDAVIYAVDTITNLITRRVSIKNGINIDWEDMDENEDTDELLLILTSAAPGFGLDDFAAGDLKDL